VKKILMICYIALLIGSCNLPISNLPQPETQPAPTVEPTATILTLVVDTAIPSPTETANPTGLVPPTQPPAPTSQTTPSISPSETPATPQEDIRDTLQSPAYVETFESGVGFGLDGKVYDDDNTLIRVEEGSLILTSRNPNGYHGWRTGGRKLRNGYIEGSFRVGACNGRDLYGMIARSPDYIKGYWIQLTCDGTWALISWDGSNKTVLTKGEDTGNIILSGADKTNRIGFLLKDNSIKVYVNGKPLTEVVNSDYPEPGSFGAFIASSNTSNFTVRVDEFSYWDTP